MRLTPLLIASSLLLAAPVLRANADNPLPKVISEGNAVASSPFKGEVRRGMGADSAAHDPTPTLPLKGRENGAGIAHVSGGVGEDEVQQIVSMAKNFNLKLLMATREGSYLADVDVAIADRRGNKLIETVTDGPYLLAKLPPGNYRITASLGGETRQQRVTLGPTGLREVRFFW